MRRAALSALLVMLALQTAAPAQESDSGTQRATWRAGIDAARARADEQRATLKAEFERRRIELRRHPPSAADLERERAGYASEQVRRDSSLQRGDIVSTDKGLFVFVGDPEGEHTPADFVPLSK
jgi:hypothetical protein